MTTLCARHFWVATLGLALLGWTSVVSAAPAPCSLLTNAEVEQTIGKLKGAPRHDIYSGSAQCVYELADGTNELEIWIGAADSLEPARKRAKQPVNVNGLGDEAILDRGRIDPSTVELHIRKGKLVVLLMLSKVARDEEKLKALAQKAVIRF